MSSHSSSLELTGLKFKLDHTRISWINLTRLQAISLTEYETLAQLLTKCKSLKSLVTGLNLTEFLREPQQQYLKNNSVVIPLNTSLDMLQIVGLAQVANKNDACKLLERLVLQLPSLRLLKLPFNTQLQISSMVERHKEAYPHLSDIVVFYGRPAVLNRANSRLRTLFTRTSAPALAIHSQP
ncbi:hypothetical protein FB639_005942 [Coemansia asiatica]|nr:hypothetical protein FB639_005942 [Coemansia asiatica]